VVVPRWFWGDLEVVRGWLSSGPGMGRLWSRVGSMMVRGWLGDGLGVA
jgi:hypothetical protein